METDRVKNIYCTDDFYADLENTFHIQSFYKYSSEQKEYEMESLDFCEEGVCISVRVTDLSSEEDYVINRFSAY